MMDRIFVEEPAVGLSLIAIVLVVIYAYVGVWLFIVPTVIGLLCLLWWAGCRFIESRRALDEIDRIAYERDRAVANLIALRHQAVQEMLEIVREDVIDGSATEVDRR